LFSDRSSQESITVVIYLAGYRWGTKAERRSECKGGLLKVYRRRVTWVILRVERSRLPPGVEDVQFNGMR
jgi:hypothetical protein